MIQSYYCDLSAYIEGERPVEINIHLDFMKNPDKVITNPITIRTKDLGLSARILEDSHPRYTEYTAIEDNKREMLRQRILVAGSHVVHLITEFVPLNIHFIDHILGHTEKNVRNGEKISFFASSDIECGEFLEIDDFSL